LRGVFGVASQGYEELGVRFDNPLAIVLTLIVILAYILLFAVYSFNKPDPTFLGMSLPLFYTMILWLIVSVCVVVAAWRVWR